MFRFALIALAGFILIAASLVPDDAFARRGGGGRLGAFGGMLELASEARYRPALNVRQIGFRSMSSSPAVA